MSKWPLASAYMLHIVIATTCYDLMILGLIKEKNLVLGLTQENLMESLVQYIYIYILTTTGSCSTISSLP